MRRPHRRVHDPMPRSLLRHLAVCALVLAVPRAVASQPLSRAEVPSRAASLSAFVPVGWQIEGEASGDLDRDGRLDAAVTLLEHGPSSAVENVRRRALLVLLREAGGDWRRVALAERLLQCPSCGGALYGVTEAPARVSIANGVLVVTQEHGSRNVVEQVFRFRYEKKTDRLWLIGFDVSDRDRATGVLVRQSTNLVTGRKVVTRLLFSERTQRFEVQSTRRSRVERSRLPLEQVDYEAY